jgi:hypothetical protein
MEFIVVHGETHITEVSYLCHFSSKPVKGSRIMPSIKIGFKCKDTYNGLKGTKHTVRGDRSHV